MGKICEILKAAASFDERLLQLCFLEIKDAKYRNKSYKNSHVKKQIHETFCSIIIPNLGLLMLADGFRVVRLESIEFSKNIAI